MNPLFTKFFWKLYFRRKKAEWNVFWIETQKFFSKNKVKYLFWALKRNPKNSRYAVKKVKKRWLFYKPRYIGIFFKSSKKPRWAILCFSFFVGGLLLSLVALLSVPLLKEFKFHRFQKTATSAFASGDFTTSLLTAQTCFLIKPEDVESLKIMVDSARELKHPRFFEWTKKLALHQSSEKEEITNWIELSLERSDLNSAKEATNHLRENFPDDEDHAYFSCILERSEGDEQASLRAFTLASGFLQNHPSSEKILTFFWDLCINSQQVYFFEQGLNSLKEYANGQDRLAKLALRRLLQIPNLPKTDRKKWAAAMWKMENPSLLDAVLCLHASYGDENLSLNSFLFILGQEFENLHTEESEEDLASILNQVGRPEMTQQLLTFKAISPSERKDLFVETIRSALSENREDLADQLMLTCRAALSPNEQDFFSFLIAKKQADGQEEKIQQILLRSTAEELETYRQFLGFFDQPDFLLGYLEEISNRNPTHQGIKYLLANSYRRLGEFSKLKQVVEGTNMPTAVGNFSGEQQTCVLKALYGNNLKECREWAENAVIQFPSSQTAKYSLALCYLRMGDPLSAQAILSPLLNAAPPICPTQRIIGSTTLHRNNFTKLARTWAPTKQKELLIDKEKELLAEIIKEKP